MTFCEGWKPTVILLCPFPSSGGIFQIFDLLYQLPTQIDTIIPRVSGLAKTWAIWKNFNFCMTKLTKKNLFCQIAKCQMAFFVSFWSYLHIAQVFAKDNILFS